MATIEDTVDFTKLLHNLTRGLCSQGINGSIEELELPCDRFPLSHDHHNILGKIGMIVIVLMICAGTVGNAMVLAAISKCRKLQKSYFYIIGALSATDLVFNLLIMPFYADSFLHRKWRFSVGLCHFNTFLGTIMVIASALHIGCIAINRYVLIVKPNYYCRIASTKAIIAQVISIWTLSFLIVLPGILGWESVVEYSDQIGRCNYVRPESKGSLYLIFGIGFLLPCCIMTFAYIQIYLTIHRSVETIIHHVNPSIRSTLRTTSKKHEAYVSVPLILVHSTNINATDKDSQVVSNGDHFEARSNYPVNSDKHVAFNGNYVATKENSIVAHNNHVVTNGNHDVIDNNHIVGNSVVASCDRYAANGNQCCTVNRDQYSVIDSPAITPESSLELEPTDTISGKCDDKLYSNLWDSRKCVTASSSCILESPDSPMGDDLAGDLDLNFSDTCACYNNKTHIAAMETECIELEDMAKPHNRSTTARRPTRGIPCQQGSDAKFKQSHTTQISAHEMDLTLDNRTGKTASLSATILDSHESSSLTSPLRTSTTLLTCHHDNMESENPLNQSLCRLHGHLHHTTDGRLHQRDIHLLHMILILFLAFSLTYLPFSVLNFVDKDGRFSREWYMLTSLAFWAGSCINPWIYGIMNTQFREAYSSILSKQRQ